MNKDQLRISLSMSIQMATVRSVAYLGVLAKLLERANRQQNMP